MANISKVCRCLVRFSCFPTSTDSIHTIEVCYISKSRMKHQQKSELPFDNYSYCKCVFVDSLTEYIGPPNYVHYECGLVNQI